MKKSLFLVISLMTLLTSLGIGAYMGKMKHRIPFEHATLVEPAKDLAGIVLINAQGLLVDQESLKGHWTLLTVGYGTCHDTCPATLGYLKGEMDTFSAQGVEVAFVSVDSARDNPKSLTHYLNNIDPRFKGYIASETMAPKLTELLGAYISKNADNTVSHSSAIFVLDPEARWVAVYTQPPEKGRLASDINRVAMR